MLLVGAAKADITPMVKGIGMMGWGRFDNRAQEIESHLFSRAFYIEETETSSRLVIAVIEICFTSISIRQGVLEELNRRLPELKLQERELMITATHTHSAPGGYSHYLLYNMTTPGYSPVVYQKYVSGIVESIVSAYERKEAAEMRWNSGDFPLDIPVVFNRSISSWNLNKDTIKYKHKDRHRATNRKMNLLRFDSPSGRPIAQINWFACHSTSVHGDNDRISSDNKGYAAREFERAMTPENPDFIAAFAQGAPGDVTPNYSRHRGFRDVRGKFKNDFRNARHNGTFQLKHAQILYKEAASSQPIEPKIDSVFTYADLSNVAVDPKYSNGLEGQRTGPAALGSSFLLGTDEGPGLPKLMLPLLNAVAIIQGFFVGLWNRLQDPHRKGFYLDDPVQGKKVVFVETGRNRILGASNWTKLIIPRWIHPAVRDFKKVYESGVMEGKSMTPQVLPLQMIRLGGLVVAAMPSEFTTQSAYRLREGVLRQLSTVGVQDVQVCCYSNGYAGYVTTFEEYQNQRYEGGSTHFGKWTLAAYQTLIDKMTQAWLRGGHDPLYVGLKPHQFTEDELSNYLFIG